MEEENKTEMFNRLALKYAERFKGKVQVIPKVPVRGLQDFSIWYTPGVAAVSTAISKNPDLSFELTGRWNTIAVVTDGTRVLGLGNVGPEAAMAVMEGKALIFKYLGGVNAVPLPIRARDQNEFVNVVKNLEPSFGGINLEDIESPKCFYVLEKLQKEMSIPVWHDDQLGTATITLAALYNALKLVNKKKEDVKVVLNGAGAANIATAYLLIEAGFKPGNLILVDSKGILEPEREDMDHLMLTNPWKYNLAMITNDERRKGTVVEALKGSDVLISASKSGPDVIKKEWISSMNSDSIVFALANPIPEIWPKDAKSAGAKIVATGRGDFPNQVNNSLVFPAVFRGVLDARAKGVNYKVMVAAAQEIADFVEEPNYDKIVPTMEDWLVYPRVAAAVASKTVELNLARKVNSKEGFYKEALEIIEETRKIFETLMNMNLIRKLDEEVIL